VLLAAAGFLALLVAVLTVTWVSDGRNQPAVATSAVPPAPGANGAPSAPAAPGPAQPQSAQLEQAVRTYYALLPEDTDAAWQYLGAAERAKARGFAGYDQFWSQIDQISIRGLTVTGNTVLVNLQFEPENRRPTFERYRLTMGTASDGRVLIESASRLGTFTLAGG
jgi:hypothetical protein